MPPLVKFGNYTKAEREEMVKKGWALPDDESGGAFLIVSRDDLKDALHRIGTTKHARSNVVQLIRRRADELGATDMLGDKTAPVKAKSGATVRGSWNDAAKFTSRQVTPEGMVIRRGKVFEAGPRLDMHGIPFNVTEAELAQMVLEFEPFPVGSGHPEAPSPLDGHLGQVTNFYIGDNPKDLWAEAHIPPFVDEVLGDSDARVSMVFDRYTKKPLGLDFVNEPNVVDAALMASFARSRNDTPSGQAAMQSVHDAATKHGAVCSKKAMHASRHESTAIQQVHDIAAEHGAKCEGGMSSFARRHNVAIDWSKVFGGLFSAAEAHESGAATAEFASDDPANDFEANWQESRTGGLGAGATADCDPSCCASGDCDCGDCGRCGKTDSATTEASPMAGAAGTSAHAAAQVEAPVVRLNPATAELEAERARNRALEADLNRERAYRIEGEAVAFAEGEIHAQRSLPAEQETLMELYRQAAADDMILGTVKLADGKVASRTERLKTLFASRSEHWMTKELLAASMSPEVMMSAMRTAQANEPQPLTPEAKKKYMEMTETGRSAMARASAAQK